jgi:chromosome partitioning protein
MALLRGAFPWRAAVVGAHIARAPGSRADRALIFGRLVHDPSVIYRWVKPGAGMLPRASAFLDRMTDKLHVVIAVVNNKGGVGKTTTSVNLAAALAMPRRRVLLIDLDSQASASLWLGVDRAHLSPSCANCLLQQYPVPKAIRPTRVPYLDLITGSVEIASADLALADVPGRELALRNMLQRVRQRYDAIVLDCPPNLSLVGVNAIVAADELIVPVTPQHLAVEGLVSLLGSVERVRVRLGTRSHLLGILLSMVDPSRAVGGELRKHLRAKYRDQVFRTEIITSRGLEEAPASMKTIFQHAPRSRAAGVFHSLAEEVLQRQRSLRH